MVVSFFQKCSIESLQPNGGLNTHLIELLWRTNDSILPKKEKYNIFYSIKRKMLQIIMYNIPSIRLEIAEEQKVDEDFTACFFCIAQKIK